MTGRVGAHPAASARDPHVRMNVSAAPERCGAESWPDHVHSFSPNAIRRHGGSFALLLKVLPVTAVYGVLRNFTSGKITYVAAQSIVETSPGSTYFRAQDRREHSRSSRHSGGAPLCVGIT